MVTEIFNRSTPNQDIFFKPYSQRYYSYYDHAHDKHCYYVSPEFGKFTRLVGQNTILEGFEITDFTSTSTSISISINKGRIIINDTYVEIHTDNTIVFDQAHMFSDTGFFVLSASFQNHNVLRDNDLRYHLTYFNSDNVSFNDFDLEKDKVILQVFDFTKNGNDISGISINESPTIILDGVEYIVRNDETESIDVLIDGGLVEIEAEGLPEGGEFTLYDLQSNLENIVFGGSVIKPLILRED